MVGIQHQALKSPQGAALNPSGTSFYMLASVTQS